MSQASKWGAAENPFPTERKHDPNAPAGIAYYRRAKCSKCGTRKYWRDNTPSGAAVPAIVSAFRKKGWEMNDRGRGICPDCLAPRKKEKVALSDLGAAMNLTTNHIRLNQPGPVIETTYPPPLAPRATVADYLTGPSPSQLDMSHVPTEQPMSPEPEPEPTPPTTNRPDKYIRADIRTALRIRDQLTAVVERHAEGFARYREGFSDQIVAEAVAVACGHPVSPHSVSKLRRDLYGNMKTAPIPKPQTETVTVTIDPNPELLATLATAHKEVALLKSELLTLSDMALELATRCGRIVEGK